MGNIPEGSGTDSDSENTTRAVLVLGAYGFIGSGIVEHLRSVGFEVTGLGRNRGMALRTFPELRWIIRDLADLQSVQAWHDVLDGVGAVVNCAGALQDGGGDRLEVVHHNAIGALATACSASGIAIVQISAAGTDRRAEMPFFHTKAAGDEAIRISGARHVIIRPGLVLGRSAYGSTALLRLLAATPMVQPVAFADALVQTVGMPDLAGAVEKAVRGELPDGAIFDLVEDTPHRLDELAGVMRNWLGFRPPLMTINVPAALVRPISAIADLLGYLGWRSPLRSSAIAAIERNVTGDATTWRGLNGSPVCDLKTTLAGMRALPADRLAARIGLIMPLAVAMLFVFWLASGLVGLIRLDAAAQILVDAGWTGGPAKAAVAGWSLVDMLLAGMILIRRHAVLACQAMASVSAFYLAAATFVAPALWADPLGPLVKILPALMLAVAGAIMLERR